MLRARLVAVEGADHFAHAAQPEAFARFIRQAVAEGEQRREREEREA
jgi:pimeloyl-ACP methyl ester carboxylesterase